MILANGYCKQFHEVYCDIKNVVLVTFVESVEKSLDWTNQRKASLIWHLQSILYHVDKLLVHIGPHWSSVYYKICQKKPVQKGDILLYQKCSVLCL